jgi:hypothetical protein
MKKEVKMKENIGGNRKKIGEKTPENTDNP